MGLCFSGLTVVVVATGLGDRLKAIFPLGGGVVGKCADGRRYIE